MKVVADTPNGHLVSMTHREVAQLLGHRSEKDIPYQEKDIRVGSVMELPDPRGSVDRPARVAVSPVSRCTEILRACGDSLISLLEFSYPLDHPRMPFTMMPYKARAVLEHADYISGWLNIMQEGAIHPIRCKHPMIPSELLNSPITLLLEDREMMIDVDRSNATFAIGFMRRHNIKSFADIEHIDPRRVYNDRGWGPQRHSWLREWALDKGYTLPGYPEARQINAPQMIPDVHVEYPETPWWEGRSPFLDPNRSRRERIDDI